MDEIDKIIFIETVEIMLKENIVSLQNFMMKCRGVISEPTLRIYMSKKRFPSLNKYLIMKEKINNEFKIEMDTAQFYLLKKKNYDNIDQYRKELYCKKYGLQK